MSVPRAAIADAIYVALRQKVDDVELGGGDVLLQFAGLHSSQPNLHHTSSTPQCIPLARAMEGNDHGEPSSALHGIAWALSLSPIYGTIPLWPTT